MSLFLAFHNCVERRIDVFPLGKQVTQNLFAFTRENIKSFLSLVFLAPFARQQSLGFKSTKEGIQGAFVNLHAMFGEGFAQRVAVLLGSELRKNRQNQGTAAEFQPKVLKEIGLTLVHILYVIYCTQYTVQRTVMAVK
jgi:hypothetical protein